MECFTIMSNEIEGRIDPFYYRPEFREFERLFKKFKAKKLGEIATFQYGLNEIAKDKGDIVYIRITDIDEQGLLKKDELAYLDYKNSYHKYRLNKGDLLIARIGATFGKTYYFDEKFNAVFAGYLIRIKPKNNEINPKFLFYFFQTKYFWNQAKKLVKGGAQPQFNANTLKELLIPFPDKQTQNRIVQLMDNAYQIKKQKETKAQQLLDSINVYVLSELGIKLPELKDQMTFVVYADDVKGGRIDAYYYQPKFEEVEKAIEEGKFEVKELKDSFSSGLVKGTLPKEDEKNGEVKVLQIKNILRNGLIDTSDYLTAKNIFKPDQKINKNDLIVVITGATIGKVGLWYSDEEFYLGGDMVKFKANENFNPYYIQAFLLSQIGQYQILREITGATNKHLAPGDVEKIKIPLPPLKIQNKIAEEVKRRMQKAEQLQKEAKEELEKAKQEVERMIID